MNKDKSDTVVKQDQNAAPKVSNERTTEKLMLEALPVAAALADGNGNILIKNSSMKDFNEIENEIRKVLSAVPNDCIAGETCIAAADLSYRLTYNKKDDEYLITLSDAALERSIQTEHEKEQQFTRLLLPNVILTCEADLTNNKLNDAKILSMEETAPGYPIYTYNEFLDYILPRVSASQRFKFHSVFSKESLISSFVHGEPVVSEEFLWKSQGGYIWVSAVATVIETRNPHSYEVRLYISDVDRQKREDMRRRDQAERDALTGLYNRMTATEKIEQFLARPGSKNASAIIMVDIDDFKIVNDTYGHMFGDAVLAELGEKIKSIFRENDILCRMGGDEFIIFMKNIDRVQSAEKKAQELAGILSTTFNSGNANCRISCSMGIAFAPTDGRQFEELYHKADVALYGAKRQGKNKWVVYTKELENVLEIPGRPKEKRKLWRTSFSNSIDEYVFKMLYEAKDLDGAITAVLKFLLGHFNFTDTFIIETAKNDALNTVYEKSIDDEFYMLNNSPYLNKIEKAKFISYLDEDGTLFVNDNEPVADDINNIIQSTGAKSLLLFSFEHEGKFKGALGFADSEKYREFTARELDELKTTAQIISVFLMHSQIEHRLKEQDGIMSSIINRMSDEVHVVGADSYKLAFLNDAARKKWPHVEVGDTCYKIYNRDEPCVNCPMNDSYDSERKEALRVERFNGEEDFCVVWLHDEVEDDEKS